MFLVVSNVPLHFYGITCNVFSFTPDFIYFESSLFFLVTVNKLCADLSYCFCNFCFISFCSDLHSLSSSAKCYGFFGISIASSLRFKGGLIIWDLSFFPYVGIDPINIPLRTGFTALHVLVYSIPIVVCFQVLSNFPFDLFFDSLVIQEGVS